METLPPTSVDPDRNQPPGAAPPRTFPQWILDRPVPRGFDRWADHDEVKFWRDPNRRDPEGHRLLDAFLKRSAVRHEA